MYQHNDSLQPTTCRSTRFRYELDIERAALYCLEVQGCVASDLDSLSVKREHFVDAAHSMVQCFVRGERLQSALEELQNMHNEYSQVGMKILSIIKFVDLNVTAVRKILKKHDKNSKQKLSHSYLSAYTNESADSHLDQLYNNEGVASLVLTLKRAFVELRQVETELLGHDDDVGDDKKARHRRIHSVPATAALAHRTHQPSLSMRSVPDLVAITHEREPVLSMIRVARDRLKKNSHYVDIIAAQLMFDDESDENDDKKLSRDEMTDMQKWSSFLVYDELLHSGTNGKCPRLCVSLLRHCSNSSPASDTHNRNDSVRNVRRAFGLERGVFRLHYWVRIISLAVALY